jgi:SNF2 family DNA or RNA helicase
MSLIKLAAEKTSVKAKSTSQQHQVSAVKQLSKSESLIAYHGLGSGKTKTAIDAGEKLAPNDSKLVVTPAALQHNFKKELIKFNVPDKNYHFVSYETYRRHPQHYIDKFKPKMIIADEFHRTKDPGTLTGDALRDARPKAKYFLGLTGSVAQNHPSEIAELLHTATGYPVLGDEKQFRSQFIRNRIVKPTFLGRLMGRKPGIVEEAKNLDKFKNVASRYIHTFAGDKEYAKHIPSVHKELKHVPMNDEQQKIYDYTFGKAPGWLKYKIKHDLPPSKQESMNIKLVRLRSHLEGRNQLLRLMLLYMICNMV